MPTRPGKTPWRKASGSRGPPTHSELSSPGQMAQLGEGVHQACSAVRTPAVPALLRSRGPSQPLMRSPQAGSGLVPRQETPACA